mgnify:CR=1 FL=1
MANWRERLTQFMQGRYGGNDTFNKALFGVFLFFLLLAIFTGRTAVSTTLNLIAVAVLIYSYFRIFSRNIARRQAENQKFLKITLRFAPCSARKAPTRHTASSAVRNAVRKCVCRWARGKSRSPVRTAAISSSSEAEENDVRVYSGIQTGNAVSGIRHLPRLLLRSVRCAPQAARRSCTLDAEL